MSLCVVIVHYETPELLAACLRSLQENGGDRITEIVVVDNSRRQKAAPVLAGFPRVTLFENSENAGFSRGVNQGIRASTADWVLVLNPDTRLLPGALDALVRFGEAHPDAGILAPRLLNPDGTLQHSCRQFYTFKTLLYRRTFLARFAQDSRVVRDHLMLDYDHAEPRVVDWVLGGAMLVRRKAADDVGGMDERFFLYFEDVDWCYRMAKRGWRVWYVPAATLEHDHRRESVRDLTGLKRHVVSSLRFYEKWSLVLFVVKRFRERLRGVATVISDVVALNLAFFLSFVLRGQLGSTLTKPLFHFAYYSDFLLLINLVVLGTLFARGLYRRAATDWAELLVELAKALLWASLIVMASTYLAYVRSYSRALVLLFFPLSVLTLFAGRAWVNHGLHSLRERLGTRRRALLVGVEPLLGQAARLLEGGDPELEWCGRVDLDGLGAGLDPASMRRRLKGLVTDERIQALVFACPAARAAELAPLGDTCRELVQELYVFTETSPWLRAGDRVEAVGPVRMVRASGAAPAEASPAARRTLELAVALVLVLPVLALLALCWVGLALGGRGPRFAPEVWDNGRREPVRSWRLRGRGEGHGWLDRTGLSRGLLLLHVLGGGLRLVGGPLRAFEGAPGPGREAASRPSGLTGEWFVRRPGAVAPADSAGATVTTDLRILVRSAARLWGLAFSS